MSKIEKRGALSITKEIFAISTLSASNCSFCRFVFDTTDFFSLYRFFGQEDDFLKFSVDIKLLYEVIKFITVVSTVTFQVNAKDFLLVVTVERASGVVSIFQFDIVELEDIIEPDDDRESFAGNISSLPETLIVSLNNFAQATSEIILQCKTEGLIFSSLVEEQEEKHTGTDLQTQVAVEQNDLIDYSNDATIKLSFTLKELKAFLEFCASTKAPIHIFFDVDKPLLMTNCRHCSSRIIGEMCVSTISLPVLEKRIAPLEFSSDQEFNELAEQVPDTQTKKRNIELEFPLDEEFIELAEQVLDTQTKKRKAELEFPLDEDFIELAEQVLESVNIETLNQELCPVVVVSSETEATEPF